MKKIVVILLLIAITALNCAAFGHPKKVKCKKSIYFFEEVKKDEYFNYLDEFVQNGKYDVTKYSDQYGYIFVNYKVRKKFIPAKLLLKQYGNDVYLFVDTKKKNSKLEKGLYASLKKHAKSSSLYKDDFFCKQLSKDINSIETTGKPILEETQYNPGVYVINMKRYVGYNKKTPLWMKRQERKERKTEKKANKKL